MLGFWNSPQAVSTIRPGATWFAVAMTMATFGCAQVADLQEHQQYQGFPDSLSVPCSNGTLTVDCDKVQTTAPQDGHVLAARPSYKISGNDVIDQVTGLSWYRPPIEPMGHAAAIDACDALPGDYRLPTRLELVSLLDFRADTNARIDPDMFPDMQGARYWTATQYGNDVNQYWTVDFCPSCFSQYLLSSTYISTNAGVLCVKSAGEPFDVGPFEAAGVEDRFLLDTRTGLMWMKKALKTDKNWANSLQACADSQDGAYGDFRAANIKELVTIADETKVGTSKPTLRDPFEIDGNQVIWSSTPSSSVGKIFTMNTLGSSVDEQVAGLSYHRIFCVRGPD